MDAEVAEQLERDRKAERFTLIEPPQYPEKPSSPNRLAIIMAGFVLSIVGGGTFGATREALDDTVKGSAELVRILRVPILGVVPGVQLDSERRRLIKMRWILAGSVAVALIIMLLIINFIVMPLDVIWFSLLRRFSV